MTSRLTVTVSPDVAGTGPHTLEAAGKLPHLGDAGQGVNRQLPHLGDAGRGVNGPDDTAFAKGGSGATDSPWHNPTPDLPPVYGYFQLLAQRLRRRLPLRGLPLRRRGRGMRDHGTRARYVVEKCRCAPCTEANRAGHAKARRLVAYPSRNGGTAHGRLVCITGARP